VFVQQDLFNMCALTVAQALVAGLDGADVAEELAQEYGKVYRDSELASDFLSAAHQILPLVARLISSEPLDPRVAGACKTLSHAMGKFDSDGRRKRRFLKGAIFNRNRRQIENKVLACQTDVLAYHVALTTGVIDPRSV
jgi:hypothetical protein